MRIYHNSQNISYRVPFGAVCVGTRVVLRIEASEADGVVVRTWRDDTGQGRVPMQRDGGFFTCELCMPDEPCILWYFFIIYKDGHEFYYGNAEDGLGGEGRPADYEPNSFQITVYKPFKAPQWFKDSICYSIFPDRFRRGYDYEKRKMLAKRSSLRMGPGQLFESNWNKRPSYEKDEKNCIKNWQFYGGTFEGITEKLSYLKSLGVSSVYLCPIFEAESNHRYDTADYLKPDALLGDESDFEKLCKEAASCGIGIILDGVFSHTGCDSIYFDKFGNYGGTGAWKNPDSKYYSWYSIDEESGRYSCWWGDENLPEVAELDPSHNEYICGTAGVLNKWLDLGALGWRLDVADELPDKFIENIRNTIKARTNGDDCLVIGEVWEDASNKISYGAMRKFVLGNELDGVMNYPFRNAIIDFMLNTISAGYFCRRVMSIFENYPPEALYSSMSLLGSHDRERIITILAGAGNIPSEMQYGYYLAPIDYELGKRRLKIAAILQYCLPGVPTVYYGDEAGMQGHKDPYNRGAYPWGHEDKELIEFYEKLGFIYNWHTCLKGGSFKVFANGEDVVLIDRSNSFERMVAVVNRSWKNSVVVSIGADTAESAAELLSDENLSLEHGYLMTTMAPLEAKIILFKE